MDNDESIRSQRNAAQIFNKISVIAILLLPAFPIVLLWIAGSIVVYSANIFHPNPIVREYTKFAGYRFYGLVGTLLASLGYISMLRNYLGGTINTGLLVWGISILIVVPFGIRAIMNARKENWVALADAP